MKHEGDTYKNRAFKGAYSKGWVAGYDGLEISTVPYSDHRTTSGKVTFSRGLRAAWRKGHRHGALTKDVFSKDPERTEPLLPTEARDIVLSLKPKRLRRRSIIRRS